MDTARIATLLEPFLNQPLAASELDQISTYIDLLLRWNARINLTAIRSQEQIVTRHFGESLFLARHLFETQQSPNPCPAEQNQAPLHPPQVLDIGSGAGFPALPLKLWAPHIHLTLVESNHKKSAFLNEVVRTLTLTNVNVISDRVEALAARRGPRANLVTLRAVERFGAILPEAVALLAPKAALALLIGAAQLPLIATVGTLKWHSPIPIPQSHSRVLSIGIRE
jgi:16S rRNA (guanine527-N7)-methyltransferase